MVVYTGSPTYAAYVDMTLMRSKVKVKVTVLLNFRQLAKPCMLAAMTAAPLRGFLVMQAFCNSPPVELQPYGRIEMCTLLLLLVYIIVRPHRSSTYVDAAYCYQLSSVVCLSVCLSH